MGLYLNRQVRTYLFTFGVLAVTGSTKNIIMSLQIKNLHAELSENEKILKGVNLEIKKGEIHVIMGPNGSGKSTLSNVLMGHPKYQVTEGSVELDGAELLELEADERSKKGLFMAFQYPKEIPGVNLLNFLLSITNTHRSIQNPEERKLTAFQFRNQLLKEMEELKIDPKFINRDLNKGFSGGEKKKAEILQMALIKPKFAILDETDSGLDVDSLKTVCDGIKKLANTERGILIITHYKKILEHINPNFVHVMIDGKIIKSGEADFAHEIEEKGYQWLT